jgi:hypothetical protein
MASIWDQLKTQIGLVYDAYSEFSDELAREKGFQVLSKNVQDVYGKLNKLEEINLQLQKGFKVSTERSAQLGYAIDKLGTGVVTNTQKLKGYLVELNKILPGQAKFYEKVEKSTFAKVIIKQTDQIRGQLKVSDEAYQGFMKFQTLAAEGAVAPGDMAGQFENTLLAVADLADEVDGFYEGALSDLVEGIGGLPASIRATMGQFPKQLGLAVLKSKQLGLSLEQIQQTAEGFLDVEQSIGAELEFQILSGQQLLTSDKKSLVAEMQKAAYAQDYNKQAELLTDFLLTNGEAMKDNLPLANSIATAFGLTKDELFDSYAQLKLNGSVSADLLNHKTKEVEINASNTEALKAQLDAQIKLNDQRATGEKLEDEAVSAYTKSILDSYTSVEDFSKAVTKLADDFTLLQRNSLGAADAFVDALKDSAVFKAIMGTMGVVSATTGAYKDLTTPSTGNSMITPEKAGDIFIPAGGSNVISGPLGSFSLDPKDDIIAMPNARAAIASGGSDSSALIAALQSDSSALIAALQNMTFHVTNVFNGDKIQSNLTIRKGQTLNNIGIA